MSPRAFNLRGRVGGGRCADECIRAVMRVRVRLACLLALVPIHLAVLSTLPEITLNETRMLGT